MPPRRVTSAAQVRAREREKKAIDMRKAGASYRRIAEEMEMSTSGAQLLVGRVLRNLSGLAAKEAEAYRELELERLDDLQLVVWNRALSGDMRAASLMLRILDQRARYLGLYVPERHELTGADGGPVQVEVGAAREQLASRLASIAERVRAGERPVRTNGHRSEGSPLQLGDVGSTKPDSATG